MAFVFTRTPLDEALLPQMAHALKTRIDSLSRLKYPVMWEQADRAAANDTPEKKASREKAAAIRYRLWGIVFLALGTLAALLDHIAADDTKQNESNPMIEALDGTCKTAAKIVTQKRHQRLKTAKEKADKKGVFFVDFRHGQALAHSNGTGIHGKADSDEEQFQKRHFLTLSLSFETKNARGKV